MDKPPVRPLILPSSLINLARRIQSLGEGLHLIVVITDAMGPKFIIPILFGKKVEDLRPPKVSDGNKEVIDKNRSIDVK